MKISVIVPSRLQPDPNSERGALWLDRALSNVRRQTAWEGHYWEFVVGLDPVHNHMPERFTEVDHSGRSVLKVVTSKGGQANAVNEAVAASTGEVLAFLEDDDYWTARKIDLQLAALTVVELSTSNQMETSERGDMLGVNDYPTPSGWLMRREIWDEVGAFDKTLSYHLDNDWLGRANKAGITRCHLVESGALARPGSRLELVRRHSEVVETDEVYPLVMRLQNPLGGMAHIAKDRYAAGISRLEYAKLQERFGEVPW